MNIFSNKKGDLSLSVNAIVVLVIAIIFLGLAIGFTTKLIGSSKDKLLSGIDNVDISTPANADNPIVFDTKLEVKAGGKTPIKISFYNAESKHLIQARPNIDKCYDSVNGNPVTIDPINIISAPADILPYTEQRYQAVLSSPTGSSAANYICVMNITSTGTDQSTFTKQLAITVTG